MVNYSYKSFLLRLTRWPQYIRYRQTDDKNHDNSSTAIVVCQVQAQVKRTKARFDQLKVDTMQKIDLLAASHCNMYSHVLAKYQTSLLVTFERIARRLTAVAESIQSCQYHAFSAVKAGPARPCSDTTSPAVQTV